MTTEKDRIRNLVRRMADVAAIIVEPCGFGDAEAFRRFCLENTFYLHTDTSIFEPLFGGELRTWGDKAVIGKCPMLLTGQDGVFICSWGCQFRPACAPVWANKVLDWRHVAFSADFISMAKQYVGHNQISRMYRGSTGMRAL